jgi:dUTP pyrophosphatase
MKDVKLSGGIHLIDNGLTVNIKRLNDRAEIPEYSRIGDAGLDLVATSVESNVLYTEYGTGLAIALPEGYAGYVFPRSSISKYDLSLCNAVGVIDSNYRGEIKLRFKETIALRDAPDYMVNRYNVGDKVAQLIIMPIPKVQFNEVEELDQTNRNEQGFGSSGK